MENEKSQLSSVLASVYIVLVITLVVLSPNGRFDEFWSGSVLLLTLPWSVSLFLFAWLIIHDGIKSALILSFIFVFAGVNAYLLYRIGAKFERGRKHTYKRQMKD
jgi:uncharacterized membrane protein YfhO